MHQMMRGPHLVSEATPTLRLGTSWEIAGRRVLVGEELMRHVPQHERDGSRIPHVQS